MPSSSSTRSCGPGGWSGPARRPRLWRPATCGWPHAGTSVRSTGCCSAGGGPIPAGRGLTCTTWRPRRSRPAGQADLFEPGEAGDPDDPVQPGGHLRPAWVSRWLGGQPSAALPLGGAGRHGGRAAAGGAGPAGGPADGPGHGAIRIYGRIAVRGTVGRRAADGPVRRRGGPGGVRRPAPAHRGRGGQEPGGARRRGAAARTAGGRRRFAQPGPGAHPTGPGAAWMFPTPGRGGCAPSATLIRWSARCWSGARRNGSPPPTATGGWTPISEPTAG